MRRLRSLWLGIRYPLTREQHQFVLIMKHVNRYIMEGHDTVDGTLQAIAENLEYEGLSQDGGAS